MSLLSKLILGASRSIPKRFPFQRFPRQYRTCGPSFVAVRDGYSRRNRDHRDANGRYVLAGGAAFAFGLFGEEKKEEEVPELIMTMKRCVLLIQKEEYKKAEQMLHVALRQAQSLQNEEAVTYIYDLMANLAFDVGDYPKAEALFVSVMQRLISSGTPEDDAKIVHMSLKLAKSFERRGDLGKAEEGYSFCQKILEKQIDAGTQDPDLLLLWAMCLDWYARLLLATSRHSEAFQYFLKALDVSVVINGTDHEQTAVLLNDLGTISFMKGEEDAAIDYLNRAVDIGKKLPEMEDLGAIYVNLGNALAKKGLYAAAKKSCQEAWRISKKQNDGESLAEASDCLDELKKILAS